MGPTILAVETSKDFPTSAEVVIIGGGIVGLTTALTLAERNISVVVLEKGHIVGEQSSRNLGWIRKTSRLADDIPLALAADKLWAKMPERVGSDVGYKQSGIMFLARTEQQMEKHENWLKSVSHLGLDSKLLTPAEIATKVPGGKSQWIGGVYTPSDGRAEPTLASSAIAKAAMAKGVKVIENCAVRTLKMSAGKVSGVITEKGVIRCEQVLLAGGLWSRRFLGNMGVSLPTLPLICSVMRTKPMEGPTDISVGAPDFSFRKHKDGGYIITQRGALGSPITLDHLLIGNRYMDQLRDQFGALRIGVNKFSFQDLALARRWKEEQISPFEKLRTMDPTPSSALNNEAMDNLRAAWPIFEKAEIEQVWAGAIDVTPDTNPVIGAVEQIPGLTLATGMSGHGFGTSPAVGHLAADLISGYKPIVDPAPYRFDRF